MDSIRETLTNCRVVQDEIFGPVVTIIPFDTEEDVIKLANDIKYTSLPITFPCSRRIRYGLSATVWTENIGVANRLSMELQVGTVWVNCWLNRDLRST